MDRELAASLARQAIDNVGREYPNAPALLLRSATDLVEPRGVHPAFFGSYDWHSSVHQHWLLVRLLRIGSLGDGAAVAAHAALGRSLRVANLEVEATYLRDHPAFERPYGWAWALALATELVALDESGDADAPAWVRAMEPLVAVIRGTWLAHLDRATYPVRAGTHPNSAFAMTLALDHARAAGGDEAFATALEKKARAWFLGDRAYPAAFEPDGEDFLSGALVEAALMARCLPAGEFGTWFDGFLPAWPPNLLEPATVADRTDPKLVHLDGLNLSRAWCWRRLAAALGASSERGREAAAAADRHLDAALPHLVDGDYVGTHWLGTFALLALTGG